MKPVDYCQAAKRHFTDAELLMDSMRHANAGHLYGFVAECGIKSLLIWNGYTADPVTGEIDKEKKLEKNFRTHADDLVSKINMIHTFLDGRGAAKYLAMIPNVGCFSNWHTAHRYYIESALPSSVSDWRDAAREVMNMLDAAMLDGVTI